MKQLPRHIPYLELVLLLAALLLAGVLYWEWEQGRQLERRLLAWRKIPTTPAPLLPIQPEFELPPPQTGWPELQARPLFATSRRFPVVAANGASAMKKGQFVLVGVLLAQPKQSALLRDVQTGKTEAVAVGSSVRGLTLERVTPGLAVLRQGEETEELSLNVLRGSVKPPAPMPPPSANPFPTPIPTPPPPMSGR